MIYDNLLLLNVVGAIILFIILILWMNVGADVKEAEK